MQKILLVRPNPEGLGGVSSYYKAVMPHLIDSKYEIISLEIGSVQKSFINIHPLVDQIRYAIALKKNPDLVHINPSLGWKSFIRDALFVLLAKRNGIKVLTFFHGWDNDFAKIVDKYFSGFFKATFAKSDSFIVLANSFKSKLRQWGTQPSVRVSTTVVDEQLLTDFSIRKKLDRMKNEKEVKILYLARLEKTKGVFDVVDSVKILIDKGVNVSLAITGDGPLLEELRVYIKSLGLPRQTISLLGYVRGEDKIRALTESSIYCFPTYFGEGLPTSVLEAMAFAMPVITTSVGGLADFFQDGKMGVVVKPKNGHEIAESIEKLVKNRNKLVSMAEYNYGYAQQYLLGPKVATFLKQTYEETIKNND
nr:glycosyltransferase family 4 protein [uncultured Desulfobacter sp.]